MSLAPEALQNSPTYRSFRRIPFIGSWPEHHVDDIVSEVVDGAQASLQNAVGSAEYREVVDQMLKKAFTTVTQELTRLKSAEMVKTLIIDMLEEQKRKLLA